MPPAPTNAGFTWVLLATEVKRDHEKSGAYRSFRIQRPNRANNQRMTEEELLEGYRKVGALTFDCRTLVSSSTGEHDLSSPESHFQRAGYRWKASGSKPRFLPTKHVRVNHVDRSCIHYLSLAQVWAKVTS